MPTAAEASFAPTPLSSDLRAGIEQLSAQQEITFTQYLKVILPLDGFVYWVKADLLSPSATYNSASSPYNSVYWNGQATITTAARQIVARGSLHFASTKIQDETESYGRNRIVFTSEDPLHQDFSQINNSMIYIGTLGGAFSGVRFAFSNRENFYKQADIWHYVGDAVYPFMGTQIIDNAQQINTNQQIVSNSLPLWLKLNNYTPTLPSYGFGNTTPLFPSFLVDPNTPPPFASVHIYPSSTQAIASTPRIGFRSSHQQLTRERVKITIYGLGNGYAMDFVDCVNQYSTDYDLFGLMNVPTMRDEKMSQDELAIIAQKKSIEYEISYYQLRARHIARQIIGQAIPTFTTVPAQFSTYDPENPGKDF